VATFAGLKNPGHAETHAAAGSRTRSLGFEDVVETLFCLAFDGLEPGTTIAAHRGCVAFDDLCPHEVFERPLVRSEEDGVDGDSLPWVYRLQAMYS